MLDSLHERDASAWAGQQAIRDSPSLRRRSNLVMHAAYPKALLKAQAETRLGPGRFPAGCTRSAAQLLDDTFLPA